jgi:hypothetical protein
VAARDEFLQGARPKPGDLAVGLARADTVTRMRAISQLQRQRGNAYVQRLVTNLIDTKLARTTDDRHQLELPAGASTWRPTPSTANAGDLELPHHLHRDARAATQRQASRHNVADKPRSATLFLQRYPVPGNLDCSEVVDWLNSNSPYAPEWAQTNCNYSFNGKARVATTNLPDGTVQARARGHAGLSVTVTCPIDRPEWSPSRRPNRADEVRAWQAMRAALDAHEQQHRKIGEAWRSKLEQLWRKADVTATGSDAQDARANLVAALQAEQQGWIDQAQAAQNAIDPFQGATLDCP